MRVVGLGVLRNKLGEYVRRASDGEVVLVTNRGRVVAELVPRQAGRSTVPADALLAETVRRGWVTLPAAPGIGPPPRKPVIPFRDLMRGIEGDRAGR